MQARARERANQWIAQGALTNSKRPEAYLQGVYPTHFSHGEGCYLYDENGEGYLDFVGGLGTNLFGYGHPVISEAVRAVLRKGPSLSFPSLLEIEVAEMLCRFTGYDKVRFFKTGTEACIAALRIAKTAYPEAKTISEGYHGWSDQFVQLTEPAHGCFKSDDIIDIKDNRDKLVGKIVITEPVLLDDSTDRIAELKQYGAYAKCVIYDEIVTGFRFPKHFVYQWASTKPDILVLGKGLANGFPMSAVLMSNKLANADWFCSGTYCGDLVGLVATKACLELAKKSNSENLYYYAKRFLTKLNNILKPLNFQIQGYGTRGFMALDQHDELLFIQEMSKAGVLLGKAFFFNYAHLEENTDHLVLNVAADIVQKIIHKKVKPEWEAPPTSSFVRY